MASLFPPNPVNFWLKRWIGGIGCPLMLTGFAIYSLATNHSYAIGAYSRHIYFVEVTDFKAALMVIAYLGFALFLFSRYHAPYSRRFAGISEYIEVTGLLLACTGICWCSWLLLTGPP